MAYLFYRGKLPENCREAYDRMKDGLVALSQEIDLGKVDTSVLSVLMEYVTADEPIIYYCDSFSFSVNKLTGKVLAKPHYTIPLEEIPLYTKAIYVGMKGIVRNIRAKTEAAIVAELHDFMCKKITYVNSDFYSHGIYGALVRRKAVCDGIAEAFKMCCDDLGVACIKVTGKAKSSADAQKAEPHAWNKVRINGVWYNIDVTFDVGLSKNSIVRHNYYLVSDEEIKASHFPDEKTVDCRIKSRYYIENSLKARSAQEFDQIFRAHCRSGEKTQFEVDLSEICDKDNITDFTQKTIDRVFDSLPGAWRIVQSFDKVRMVVYLEIN